MTNARVGHGYDVHAFTEGDAITLGGVELPFSHAFAAHSDGDVLIHALCDAILGAAALGDIGQHFPDSSDDHLNRDSREFLREVYALARRNGFEFVNADLTIVAQAPKMAPHLHEMKLRLCDDLECDLSCLNIKATTTEGLGFTGQGEGIAVHAVCLLEKAG
jgi:2-C-methyl-D-erythritol 2,4-cyclodiphosphate synthase